MIPPPQQGKSLNTCSYIDNNVCNEGQVETDEILPCYECVHNYIS